MSAVDEYQREPGLIGAGMADRQRSTEGQRMSQYLDGMTRERYEAMAAACGVERLVSEILLRDQQMRHAEESHRESLGLVARRYGRQAQAVAYLLRNYQQMGKRSVPLKTLSQTLANPGYILDEDGEP